MLCDVSSTRVDGQNLCGILRSVHLVNIRRNGPNPAHDNTREVHRGVLAQACCPGLHDCIEVRQVCFFEKLAARAVHASDCSSEIDMLMQKFVRRPMLQNI